MTFKDDLAADIGTFFDVREFGEYKELDNVILPAQVMKYTAEKSARVSDNFTGLHGDFFIVYFPSAPYIKKRNRLPKHGEQMYIGKKRYDIVSVTEESGVAKVVCSSYRQNIARYK